MGTGRKVIAGTGGADGKRDKAPICEDRGSVTERYWRLGGSKVEVVLASQHELL